MTFRATYRVQLNAGFTLADLRAIVPYLDSLGISHVYCSPMLMARRGSAHGYDVADPQRLNPEIGTEDDLRMLAAELRARGMSILLDIVPNHMGVGADNPYWEDVLTHGERSQYARWFDVAWEEDAAASGRRRVVLPVLGDELPRVIERGELAVDARDPIPRLRYFESSWPLDPARLPAELQVVHFDPTSVTDASRLFAGPEHARQMEALLDAQHYRLTFWRRAPNEINYRRFFDINDLVALRMEDPQVFDETHALVLRWVEEGIVGGLRVDHVDGLLDPRGYLERLRDAVRSRTSEPVPILVEKILSPGESLRDTWPVEGTTGYEFLNDLEDLFIAAEGYAAIERGYRGLRRLRAAESFEHFATTGKERVLATALRPDVARLARALRPLLRGTHAASWSMRQLRDAIARFIVALPVYRTYVAAPGAAHPDDVATIARALDTVRATGDADAIAGVTLVADVLLGRVGIAEREAWTGFVARLQQASGPATAKGVEDTALYVYVPLASRNEVGGAPDRPLADAPARLHAANAERARRWPRALLATNTHDTKRSADVRARLDALALAPDEWTRYVARWRRLNRRHRAVVRGRLAPDTNTEYLLYQTLVGIWPAARPGRRVDDLPDETWRRAAGERLREYVLKAAREAKRQTSWVDPDTEFEQALTRFVDAIMVPEADAPFLTDVARLVAKIAEPGRAISFARMLVHMTAPGVPDLYRGDEFWNHTLVDPDNRRPVDFARRAELLERLGATPAAEPADTGDDAAKLRLTAALLRARRARPHTFVGGSYTPLAVAAPGVFAFARSGTDGHAIAIATWPVRLGARTGASTGGITLTLPAELRALRWSSVLGGPAPLEFPDGQVDVASTVGDTGVALLLST